MIKFQIWWSTKIRIKEWIRTNSLIKSTQKELQILKIWADYLLNYSSMEALNLGYLIANKEQRIKNRLHQEQFRSWFPSIIR